MQASKLAWELLKRGGVSNCMSLLYTSRGGTEPLTEIKSRLYLWNYTQLEQSIQIKSIATFKSELCLIPCGYSEQQLIILDSNGATKATHTLTQSQPITTLTNQAPSRHQIATLSKEYLYTAATQHGTITQYSRTTCQKIHEFGQDLTTITDMCIGPDDNLLYVGAYRRSDRFHGILVYKPTTNSNTYLLHSLTSHVYPSALSFDVNGHLHVCDIKHDCAGIIKVFDTVGNKMAEYGKGHLTNPSKIVASHPDGYTIVLESVSLLVFHNYKYMYSIEACEYGITGIGVTSDNGNVWITTGNSNTLLKIPSLFVLYRPPPSLSLLCKSTIIVHLNELPIQLLPTRYIRLLKDWTHCLNITTAPSLLQTTNSQQLLTTHATNNKQQKGVVFVMKVRKNYGWSVLKSLLEKRLEQVIEDIYLL